MQHQTAGSWSKEVLPIVLPDEYCWQSIERVGGEDMISESIYLFSLRLHLSFIFILNKAYRKVTAFFPG